MVFQQSIAQLFIYLLTKIHSICNRNHENLFKIVSFIYICEEKKFIALNKKTFYYLTSLTVFIFLFFTSCNKEAIDSDQNLATEEEGALDSDDTAISLEGELQISDFIWQGLNYFYYWQEEIEALADSKLNDQKTYAQFINENPDPDAFFDSLLHPDDRFSWIQDDYQELENTLQGIFATNGVEFGLLYACQDCDEIVGFVKYILKGSDADGKNIKRGDLFTGVNGTTLTVNNYRSLLYGDELTYTLNMATAENGALVGNGISVELTKVENFETDPIQIQTVLETSTGKVGYLMYNQFVGDKSDALNDVMAGFKSQGIIDLVLDLRYNGGGSVRNCVELASMITGQFSNEVFAKQVWNSKLNAYFLDRYGEESQIDRFVSSLSNGTAINSLGLSRLFVLTTSESASASELLINGLAPYIEVIQIGEQTVGKNVGSITVYDYIDNQQTKNPDHKYAMQPIVLKVANSEGFADYADGLPPTLAADEDVKNMGVLGDVNETFLAIALNRITGSAKFTIPKASLPRTLLVEDPLLIQRQRMIVDFNLAEQD
jgi:C-terminal processing protease CtpA/Prc